MADLHLTFDLLAAYDAGHITHRELLDLTARHLFGICSTCATEYQAFQAGVPVEGSTLGPVDGEAPGKPEHGRSEYTRPVRAVADGARELEDALHRERVQAARSSGSSGGPQSISSAR